MKFKKATALLLAIIMVLGVIPSTALATNWGEGDTLEDALSELKVGFNSTLLDWLWLPDMGSIKLRYAYFWYDNQRTGEKNQHPVYCVGATRS